jgi:uncharacterized protein YndB with AHSA1/START domain
VTNEFTRPEAAADLNLSRLVDAPRELVFRVWTEAEHLAQWFAPRRVDIPFCRIDPRPDGAIHFCHRTQDGMEVWVKGSYREFVAPERLVFSLWFVDAGGAPAPHPMFPDWPTDTSILTTVTFADIDGKTQLTVRQALVPGAVQASDTFGRERDAARAGWIETLDRLQEHVAAQAARG